MENIKVRWSKQDACYIASTKGSDLIGCGNSKKEAIVHLKNHMEDEKETPRIRKR